MYFLFLIRPYDLILDSQLEVNNSNLQEVSQHTTSVTLPTVKELKRCDSILAHRKRLRECLERQACKMLKFQVTSNALFNSRCR